MESWGYDILNDKIYYHVENLQTIELQGKTVAPAYAGGQSQVWLSAGEGYTRRHRWFAFVTDKKLTEDDALKTAKALYADYIWKEIEDLENRIGKHKHRLEKMGFSTERRLP